MSFGGGIKILFIYTDVFIITDKPKASIKCNIVKNSCGTLKLNLEL